jgi:hypothetical protein
VADDIPEWKLVNDLEGRGGGWGGGLIIGKMNRLRPNDGSSEGSSVEERSSELLADTNVSASLLSPSSFLATLQADLNVWHLGFKCSSTLQQCFWSAS